jgi:hypothetical protein
VAIAERQHPLGANQTLVTQRATYNRRAKHA